MKAIRVRVGQAAWALAKLFRYFVKSYTRSLFGAIGEDVHIGNYCRFTEKTIFVGDHVHIGDYCVLQSTHGRIVIKDHVMLGPGVHIHGGNHDYTHVGRYMIDINEKAYDQDGVITIEDDVWVAANAIILKGVTIGQGSIISAGAVVTKSVPPYSVVAGIPARVMKQRFTESQIRQHRNVLGIK